MTDVRRVMAGRAIRGAADGFVSVLLAQYLTDLGLSPFEVGAVITATLLGSAALTLAVGLLGSHRELSRLLMASCVLMMMTGVGFALSPAFWALVLVATIGTLNPSAGDVSVFLPLEQAFLADRVAPADRPRTYAIYNLGGVLAGALGALASGLPARVTHATGWRLTSVERIGFMAYAVAALAILSIYRTIETVRASGVPALRASTSVTRRSLGPSRPMVLRLAALFSLDSAGSGFVVTSLLVLWLHLRFHLSRGQTASVFFAAGLLGATSQLLAPVMARRVGLVRTMVFTHVPANVLLGAAAFAPNGAAAVSLLLVRSLFAQMDVPARQAFVMGVVAPAERAAASSITNVPRSLASATTPLLAGAMLSRSTFGWPLLIAGASKLSYDLILLVLYRNVAEAHESQVP